MRKLVFALAASVALVSMVPAASSISLAPLGTQLTGAFRDADPRNAEINAYDPVGQRVYVVNPQFGRVDVINISNPSAPTSNIADSIDLAAACLAALGPSCPVAPGNEPNSVDIHGELMAVAVSNAVRTDNGHAVFFQLQGANPPVLMAALEVGAVPDMIKFSDDGRWVLTANEGEPNQAYTIDPPGSVSIIDVARIGAADAVRTAGFDRFDLPGQRQKLELDGVRIFGPGASVAQDLEPEYIAIAGNKAYVTLQENNALAIINIDEASVEKVVGLGLKNHLDPANELDPSDQNGTLLDKFPVYGLYQPDAIQAISNNGKQFLIMANEGDAREYTGSPGYVEALRVSSNSYPLDPTAFPNANDLKTTSPLRRLNVSKASGDLDHDGDFDRIEVFGARSVSIRDQQGRLVWDSGDMLERLVESLDSPITVPFTTLFNISNNANTRDNRSDDKGIEPESVVVGQVGGRLYGFVGLERDSGVVVLDLSNPAAPTIAAYVTNRKFPLNPDGSFASCNSSPTPCGDLGPEGLTFVPAAQSPTGEALLIVSNEVSSTTTVWEVK
jgi:hypothetical protein